MIGIEITDPDSTAVILSTRSRDVADWETANKLASANQDFCGFLKCVPNSRKSKEIMREKHDPVFDRGHLLLMLASRK